MKYSSPILEQFLILHNQYLYILFYFIFSQPVLVKKFSFASR